MKLHGRASAHGAMGHRIAPLRWTHFSFRGKCYPVCGMVHIKDPLLLIEKSSMCVLSGYLRGHTFRRHTSVDKMY